TIRIDTQHPSCNCTGSHSNNIFWFGHLLINLTKEGAIFIVTVPAVKIRSTCLGLDVSTNP
ncbi:Hypothetical predicted protein, partial [Olea europaea subsp. europaea]